MSELRKQNTDNQRPADENIWCKIQQKNEQFSKINKGKILQALFIGDIDVVYDNLEKNMKINVIDESKNIYNVERKETK